MNTVTDVRAVPHILGYGIKLSWRNPPVAPGDAPLKGLRILRRERTFPLTADDGQSVYDGPVIGQFFDRGLKPLTTYYYTIFAFDNSAPPRYYADERSRVSALVTADYNLVERLYKLLPATHQRLDVLSPSEREQLARLIPGVLDELAALPVGLRERGPLRRFLQGALAPLNAVRSTAEGLGQLYDVNHAPPQFLLALAHWIGWETDRTLPVFQQRNEVKFAPPLYRSTGSVPNLRAIVTRYTGWECQVAEFVQSLARSNTTPQLNVFAMTERERGWEAADDASTLLGFFEENTESRATGSQPARLTGLKYQPFALRPGMEFEISADGRPTALVRFQPGDFADITHATAAEVAAVLNRLLTDVKAKAEIDGGNNLRRLVLESGSFGASSSLRIEKKGAGLLTLEGVPRGRLSVCLDSTPDTSTRMRLFYETADPLAPAMARAAADALLKETGYVQAAPVLSSQPLGRIRYKTFRNGTWSESCALSEVDDNAQGDPAAVQLAASADGRKRILLFWVENPNTAASRLRFAPGTTRLPRPARLNGHRQQPFNVAPGSYLVFRGNWPEAETFRFAENDFSDRTNVTAGRLATVLRSRLKRVSVDVQSNGALQFSTTIAGGDQPLSLDLRLSTAAAALGFDDANARADGDWGDEIDWDAPQYLSPSGGRVADPHAVVADDGKSVWLFWAAHTGGYWRIVGSRWDGSTWTKAETLSTTGTSAAAQGGSREPYAVYDATGRLGVFWTARTGVGTLEDVWTLRCRLLPPGDAVWSSEITLTAPASGERSADREPAVVRMGDGSMRLFFRSDRSGGADLWYANVAATPDSIKLDTPEPFLLGTTADYAPAPILFTPDNTLWLFFRSDRSVSPSRLQARALLSDETRVAAAQTAATPTAPPPRSQRIRDAGTLRRYAGSVSVVIGDAARNKRRRLWDDLLAYTPQGVGGEALDDDDYYTRETVGLYLSQTVKESPLEQQRIKRLLPVLAGFLPVNVRALVILSPHVETENVYDQTTTIRESYRDKYQFVEYYAGPPEAVGAAQRLPLEDPDTPAARAPGWTVFYSARLQSGATNHVTVIPNSARSDTWKLRTLSLASEIISLHK